MIRVISRFSNLSQQREEKDMQYSWFQIRYLSNKRESSILTKTARYNIWMYILLKLSKLLELFKSIRKYLHIKK